MLKKLFIVSLSLLTVNYNLYAAEPQFPLHKAARIGDSAAVQELLKNRDVNEKDSNGWTPLHWAAYAGCHAIAQLLLEAHANVNEKNIHGHTPLHGAALMGYHAVAQLLLEAHATVDVKSNAGDTPLHWAALHGHHDVAQLLLAAHANVDEKDNDGKTPLHMAVAKGHHDIVYLMTHWSDFKRGLCASLCKSILAIQHPRCGAHSPLALAFPCNAIQEVLSYLRQGTCIYSHADIVRYVTIAQQHGSAL